MSCNRCGRRCKGRLCRDCERDERYSTDPVGGEATESRDAFPRGDCHYCDLCSRPFSTLGELIRHDCNETQIAVPDGRRVDDADDQAGAGDTVAGPDAADRQEGGR